MIATHWISWVSLPRLLLLVFDAAVIGLFVRLGYERLRIRSYGPFLIDVAIIVLATQNAFALTKRWDNPIDLQTVILEFVWLVFATVGVLLSLHYTSVRISAKKHCHEKRKARHG